MSLMERNYDKHKHHKNNINKSGLVYNEKGEIYLSDGSDLLLDNKKSSNSDNKKNSIPFEGFPDSKYLPKDNYSNLSLFLSFIFLVGFFSFITR